MEEREAGREKSRSGNLKLKQQSLISKEESVSVSYLVSDLNSGLWCM